MKIIGKLPQIFFIRSRAQHIISNINLLPSEKWDRIKEFVWDKLKNNKRWKKIVKVITNLIQALTIV